jgi:hypothetical protein
LTREPAAGTSLAARALRRPDETHNVSLGID